VQFTIVLLKDFLQQTFEQLSVVFYGILVLLIGFFLARLLEKFLVFLLELISFDNILNFLKFDQFLRKGNILSSPSKLLGATLYWILMFFFIISVAFLVGLPIKIVLAKLFSYLTVVLLATVVLAIGTFIGLFLGGLVYLIGANFRLPGAKTISRLTQYAAVVMAFLLAIEQLGIGPDLLIPSIGVIIGSLGLAVAIAFGLGCKDIMADFVSNLIKGK